MHIKDDFRNCSGRDGVKNYGTDFEAAVRAAMDYVSYCNARGKHAGVEVNVYDGQPSTLKLGLEVQSVFSGKRYENGYAIPVNENKFRLVVMLYNNDYAELLEKAIWMMPNGSHFFDFRNAKYEKEDRILIDGQIYDLLKMHHQKFHEQRLHEIHIADIEGDDDGWVKAESMHYENGKPAYVVKDVEGVMGLKGSFKATISKFELEDKPIYLVMTTALKDEKAFRNYIMGLLQKQYGIRYADIAYFEEEAK